jgi:HrpA-like RNA helicase
VSQLHQLGALDGAGYVTALGKQMAGFPMLNPAVTRMLAEAANR